MTICIIQISEVWFYHLCLCIMCPRWYKVFRYTLICFLQVLYCISVALKFINDISFTEQGFSMTHCVFQCLSYQIGCLIFSDRISNRVVDTCIQYNTNRQSVMISSNAVSFLILCCLLIQQFHIPTIRTPIQHRLCRSFPFDLHSLIRSELILPISPGITLKGVFLSPIGYRSFRYLFPTHLLGYLVIYHRYLCIL